MQQKTWKLVASLAAEQVKPDPQNPNKLLVPQQPAFARRHAGFILTVAYDLLRYGVSWQAVRETCQLTGDFGPQQVNRHIFNCGFRVIHDPATWVEGSGYQGYKSVPLTENERLEAAL
jgi:hypothetical protein